MKLAYEAFDAAGRKISDVLDASDVAEAKDVLRRDGIYVMKIEAAAARTPRAAGRRTRRLGPGKRLKNLAMFTRQFGVLVRTGTAVPQALEALRRQLKDPAWRDVVADLCARVERGEALSEAMAHHPEYFDVVYRSLIAAGEAGGAFDEMLERLANLVVKQLHVRSSVIGALIYPMLLIVVAGIVLALMLTFVLPRFSGLFETLDVPLPPTTKMLMVLSAALKSYWWAMLASLIAGVVGLKLWLAGPNGKQAWDGFVLRLPQIGRIARSFATARVARLLGVLLECRVSLLEALALTRHAAGNVHYANLLTRAEDAVTRGQPISFAFNDSRLIDPAVYEAIHNGEQSGQVAPLLLGVADYMDQENDTMVRSLTSILEPVILIALGLVVALVALSMFVPLFDLTAMTSGGGP